MKSYLVKLKEETDRLRVIKEFKTEDDAIKSSLYKFIETQSKNPDDDMTCGEMGVMMRLANYAVCIIITYESGQISRDDLDLCLRRKPIQDGFYADVSPLDFDFIFESTINHRYYTSWNYLIDDLGSKTYDSEIYEPYFTLAALYSFDTIFEQLEKMLADFKAAHPDFDKMTNPERLERFFAWKDNWDDIADFLERLIAECKKRYEEQHHEH